jgi:hypothetical protein
MGRDGEEARFDERYSGKPQIGTGMGGFGQHPLVKAGEHRRSGSGSEVFAPAERQMPHRALIWLRQLPNQQHLSKNNLFGNLMLTS